MLGKPLGHLLRTLSRLTSLFPLLQLVLLLLLLLVECLSGVSEVVLDHLYLLPVVTSLYYLLLLLENLLLKGSFLITEDVKAISSFGIWLEGWDTSLSDFIWTDFDFRSWFRHIEYSSALLLNHLGVKREHGKHDTDIRGVEDHVQVL